MKCFTKGKIAMLLIIVLMTIVCTPTVAEAKSKYVSNRAIDTEQKIGNISFVARQYQVGTSYCCKIIMVDGNKTETMIDMNTTSAFVTNGEILYYVKRGKSVNEYQYKNTIYKYRVKTGEKEKVITGINYTVLGCSGRYLY